MTKTRPKSTLAQRLAPLSVATIDAMTDDEVAALMGAAPSEVATAEDRQYLREAAKVATDEWAEEMLARGKPLGAHELGRYRSAGGRPRLGAGESVQIQARLPRELAALLDAAVAKTGRSRSEVVRDALEEHLGRWAAEVSAQEGKAVVIDLMAALEASLARAKAAGGRTGQAEIPKQPGHNRKSAG